MAESGIVQAVYDVELGSVLTTDAAAADTTLYVASVAYFAPNGGTLSISDGTNTESAVAYTGVDEDTSTLTGVTALVNGYAADDTAVLVYPAATERVAEVRLDGQQDTVRARIPFSLFDRIATGFYDEAAGETIRVLVQLEREYVVVDVLGQVPSIATDTLSVVEDLRVEGTLTIEEDGLVDLESGVAVTLSGQQAAPTVAPSLSRTWYNEAFDVIDAPAGDPVGPFAYSRRRGAYHDTTDNVVVYCGWESTTLDVEVRSVDLATGVGTTVVSAISNRRYGSVTRVGSFYYVLTWKYTTGQWFVRKYDTSWVYDSEWAYTGGTALSWDSSSGYYFPGYSAMIGSDGTDLYVCDITSSNGRVKIQRINTAGVLQATINGTATYEPDASITGFVPNVTLDFGAARYLVQTAADPDYVYPLNSSGVYQSDEQFRTATTTTTIAGLLSDGTNLWTIGDGGNANDTTYSYRYRYELTHWTTESSKWWVAYSWHDSDATGGTHETTIGPSSSVTMWRRALLSVSTAAPPDNGGTDDPTAVRVYAGRGSTEPADAAMFLQYTGADGETSGSIDTTLFSGTAAPTSNDFPGANAATIASGTAGDGGASAGTGTGWELSGLGSSSGFADIQTFTADGTWTKPQAGGCTMAEIHLIGGGGGGGAGGRRAASAGGGAGGGGGSAGVVRVPLSFLSTTATVTVGAGGAGANGRSTNGDGAAGTDGEDTTFVSGSYTLTAKGGKGGGGGLSAAGGAAGTQSRASTAQVYVGGAGADGGTTSATGSSATAVPSTASTGGAGGGGGGGGVDATQHGGGDGADSWDVAGTIGRSSTTAPSTPSAKMTGWAFPGGGGGGSGSTGVGTAQAAQTGGGGGLYGGGGGGGGAALSPETSGGGGTGGDGIVVVVCY